MNKQIYNHIIEPDQINNRYKDKSHKIVFERLKHNFKTESARTSALTQKI